ncbi:4-hydroxy-tetrahydrodipicolinate synthase [Gammaproteobacteria bacterium 45_16_T64]|nr:4-hydroxy-tetrahydrodipicolinate synthase [Gammaproteobacteria bacterium 45_16_T64]
MFSGSYVALITPFRDGEIDEVALRHLVNWHIKSGTHGLVPMGTTGESSTVSRQEHQRVVEVVVEETAGRIPVIAGAGSNNPIEALEYARHAESVGADGVLCVAGYYNRPSQEGLYQHFKLIHDQTDIPIIIYNIPPRAVVDILPTTMARLAKLARVVGVKDATMDLSRIAQERLLIDKPFSFFSGDDMTAVGYNAMGGVGCISVTANVLPALCAELQVSAQAGDMRRALEVQDILTPVHQALFSEPSPGGVKYAASLLGLCLEDVRLPILPVSAESKATVKQVLARWL